VPQFGTPFGPEVAVYPQEKTKFLGLPVKKIKKSIVAIVSFSAALFAFTAEAQLLTREAQGWELYINAGALLIDARDRGPYEDGHIEDAINIPLPDMITHLNRLGKDKTRFIVVYGQKGLNVGGVSALLVKYGYTNAFFAGSYEGMLEAQGQLQSLEAVVVEGYQPLR
jgi:phage shock protein E